MSIKRNFLGLAAALAMAAQTTFAFASEKLNIVATTGMVGDAALNIGGDLVEVRSLMGPGVDPHAYRQTRTDIVALAKADLVLWNGLYLEAQMEEFLLELGQDKPVLAVAEAVPENLLIGHPDYKGRFDPHLWMNPDLWSRVVVKIRDALTELRPEGEATFNANADAYLESLRKLARYNKEVLSSVPAESRVLLTAHDAFNYFGHKYGFNVVGVQGISTESPNWSTCWWRAMSRPSSWRVPYRTAISARLSRALPPGGTRWSSAGSCFRTPWASPAPMKAPIWA